MTQPARPRLLFIGGDRARADALGASHVVSVPAALEFARRDAHDAVLVDLPAPAAEEAIARLARARLPAFIIALAHAPSLSLTLALMRAGAHEIVAVTCAPEVIAGLVADLGRRHGREPRPAPDAGPLGRLIGPSPQMAAAAEQLRHLAGRPGPVFISGEAGSGKSLAAEILQAMSADAQPLLAVDCRVRPLGSDTLEIVRRGTFVVLDGIEALGPSDQARLAGFLREDSASRVRLCCLCGLGPTALMSGRHLRQDLFYRLQGLALYLPPLRQRSGDIDALAQHVAGRPGVLSRAARQMLAGWSWPGNVRELLALLRGALVVSGGELIEPGHLVRAGFAGTAAPAAPLIRPMWQVEQDMIEAAIAAFDGNIGLAAEALELSPSTIYRKRQAWAAGRAGAA